VNLVEKAQTFLGSLGGHFVQANKIKAGGMRELLNDAMPVCPICERIIHGHLCRYIARTPLKVGREDRFLEMMNAVQCHNWDELVTFQNWEPTSAAVDVYLFKCPDERQSIAVIYCPYELEDIYKLIHHEQIEPDNMQIKGDAWLQF
jgi:hypothetical protein